MKITLVRPDYYTHLITPQIALGYLSSYLKRNSFDVMIIDALNLNLSMDGTVNRCLDADLVGISCLSDYFEEVVRLSKALKRKKKIVVLGGPHVSVLPELSLERTGADYAIIGEGEQTFLELATAIRDSLPTHNIPGVFSLGTEEFTKRELIGDLDAVPFPDWRQMDPRQYKKAPHGGVIKKFPVAPIISSRGCAFECTFCSTPRLWDRKIRFRSPKNVVDEIEYLVNNFGVKEIHFEDDNLTLKKPHVIGICEEILRRDIKIYWAMPNGTRADTIDHALLQLMKKSGCYAIAFGIESASKHILENVKKGIDLKIITEAIDMAHKEGIMTQGFFIFGLPGETKETIHETIEYARKAPLDKAQFLLLDVLPGSALWDTLSGKFQVNWIKRSYQQVSWLPDNLSKEFLQKVPSIAFRRFFCCPKRFLKMCALIKPGQLKYVLRRIYDFGIVAKFK